MASFKRVAHLLTLDEAKDLRKVDPDVLARRYQKLKGIKQSTCNALASSLRGGIGKFLKEAEKSAKLFSMEGIGDLLKDSTLEPGTDVYKAGMVLLIALVKSTISADKIAEYLKDKLTREEVRIICGRLRENKIFYYDDSGHQHISAEWGDGENGYWAFIMDSMVGAGQLVKVLDEKEAEDNPRFVSLKDFAAEGIKSGPLEG